MRKKNLFNARAADDGGDGRDSSRTARPSWPSTPTSPRAARPQRGHPLNSRGFFASEAPQGASAQNLRIGRKGKRETTLKGSPNTANGAPLQGAYITPYMVSVGAPAAYLSVGAPAAYPRLLRGDGLDKSLTLGHV